MCPIGGLLCFLRMSSSGLGLYLAKVGTRVRIPSFARGKVLLDSSDMYFGKLDRVLLKLVVSYTILEKKYGC